MLAYNQKTKEDDKGGLGKKGEGWKVECLEKGRMGWDKPLNRHPV